VSRRTLAAAVSRNVELKGCEMSNAMKIALAVLVAAAVAVALVVFTETKKTHGADINSQLGIGVSAV
jgi:hypothetical protein